jgi:hypothetical protein
MLENAPGQPNSNPNEYDHAQAALQWMQQQLAEQGLTVTPGEAFKLFKQTIIYDLKRDLQQDLAERGIDVSPDEAVALHGLRTIHLMMEHTGTTDPHDAIERMASDDSLKSYEPNE